MVRSNKKKNNSKYRDELFSFALCQAKSKIDFELHRITLFLSETAVQKKLDKTLLHSEITEEKRHEYIKQLERNVGFFNTNVIPQLYKYANVKKVMEDHYFFHKMGENFLCQQMVNFIIDLRPCYVVCTRCDENLCVANNMAVAILPSCVNNAQEEDIAVKQVVAAVPEELIDLLESKQLVALEQSNNFLKPEESNDYQENIIRELQEFVTFPSNILSLAPIPVCDDEMELG